MRLYMGDKPMTDSEAKKLLGWQEESENIKFDADLPSHGKDTRDAKFRLNNNISNRPIYTSVAQTLMQEVLRKRWFMNGETIIIGKTGLILDGQHRLLALIFANQVWQDRQGQYQEVWSTPPTLSNAVVFGIEEDDDTVNTINTGKPRSLADVFYRSEYFQDTTEQVRKKLARVAAYSVITMWSRTGAANAFCPRRTHSESLDFISRHPRLLECIKHVYEENGKESRIRKVIGLGTAAALLYLMGSSATDSSGEDHDGYIYSPNPNESYLDWKHWDKAQEFWVLLASGDKSLEQIRPAIAETIEDGCGGKPHERTAILVKAWNRFVEGKKITPECLQLEYNENDDGGSILGELPLCGGVDIGEPHSDP